MSDREKLKRALQVEVTCHKGKTFTIWPEIAEQLADAILASGWRRDDALGRRVRAAAERERGGE